MRRLPLTLMLFVVIFLWLSESLEGQTTEPSLLGTRENLVRLNEDADKEGMKRFKDDHEVLAHIDEGRLVPLPQVFCVDKRLERRFQWMTVDASRVLGDLGLEFRGIFGKCLKITSAVRTEVRQRELTRNNPNAVPSHGPRRSLHLTGSTVDVTKVGLNNVELDWLRIRLFELEIGGIIDATEETFQAVFHVTVFTNRGRRAN